jgi:hypothetical protein
MFYLSHRTECSLNNRRLPEGLAGCSEHHVYDRANYAGLTMETNPRRTYGSVNMEKFKELAAEGKTPKQISEIMDMNASYPTIYAKKHKIKLKTRRMNRNINVDKVRELAEQGLDRTEIAIKMNCCKSAISRLAKRNNIDITRQRKAHA